MTTPGTAPWRQQQAAELLAFGRGSALPQGGFGWLDEDGGVDQSKGRPLYLTARATYVFALAYLAGDIETTQLAASGLTSLTTEYVDATYRGWYASLDHHGNVTDPSKMNYAHAHTLLAASTALAAGIPAAADAFAEASAVIEKYFWSDAEGCAVESWNAEFSELESYRGANSNMHSVEAYLAAADVSGDTVWRLRALSIAANLIDGHARAHEWRVPEHYDAAWRPLPNYNADRPTDQFRPYGTTPGHSFEWARLLLTLEAGLSDPPEWLLPAAIGLFDTAVADGWAPDSHPGLIYTVDAGGRPVATTRLHWVVCEAVLAADSLHRRTGTDRFADLAARWWQHINDHFIDHSRGGWWPELTPVLEPTNSTWSGKPDLYHAYQALLVPSLPLAPTAATALRGSGAADRRSSHQQDQSPAGS